MDVRTIAQVIAASLAALTAFSDIVPIPCVKEIATIVALVLHLKPSGNQQ